MAFAPQDTSLANSEITPRYPVLPFCKVTLDKIYMAIEINYIDNGVGIEIVASGIVSGDEVLAAHQEIYSPDNLARQRYQIVDRSRCDYYCLRPEEVKKIADLDKAAARSNPNIHIAIVSPTDLQFDMSRMWQIYVEESPIVTKLFHDRQSADAWIEEQMSDKA